MIEPDPRPQDPALARSPAHTRRRIRALLKRGGAQRADDLAGALGLTAMAVRQHLYAMADAGEVESAPAPVARGRPAKLWSLTPRADAFFEDGHADLAVGLIASLRRALGDKAMDKLLAERAAQQIDQYRGRLARFKTFKRRLQELAAIRAEEGYMAEIARDPADGAWLLVENHCPICHAAAACSGLCAMELEVFRGALGPSVRVERTEHILAGARRCAYRVTPV
ncbi:MAG: transcriptional regulator [Marivibrio sp.]|uniref:helix-turn-helix transcriptional regulator n=1 Tax=Marivibrio sp. TaxID=2039719 RepID=UPI0032F05590